MLGKSMQGVITLEETVAFDRAADIDLSLIKGDLRMYLLNRRDILPLSYALFMGIESIRKEYAEVKQHAVALISAEIELNINFAPRVAEHILLTDIRNKESLLSVALSSIMLAKVYASLPKEEQNAEKIFVLATVGVRNLMSDVLGRKLLDDVFTRTYLDLAESVFADVAALPSVRDLLYWHDQIVAGYYGRATDSLVIQWRTEQAALRRYAQSEEYVCREEDGYIMHMFGF
jgi:hypothetical protein